MLNVNADTAAGEIASAVKASQLIFLTDVPGIFDSSKRLIKKLTRQQAQSLLESGVVSGGMTPKLEACLKGLETGKVSRVVDGRKPGALLDSLEGEDIGTVIV
jgi:acetylglutamate kinase